MTQKVPATMTTEGLTAAGVTAQVAAAQAAASVKLAGDVVQVVNTQTGAVLTTATIMPFDDTIPQITEGGEFLTRAITPTSASNVLKIDVLLNASPGNLGYVTAALFQDATAGALAVGAHYEGASTYCQVAFTYFMAAGTTSATTFRVRAGQHVAGTLTINGDGGARRLGGVLMSSITITEIKA